MQFEHMRIAILGKKHQKEVVRALDRLGYREAWMNEDTWRIVTYRDGTYEGYALAMPRTIDTTLECLLIKGGQDQCDSDQYVAG